MDILIIYVRLDGEITNFEQVMMTVYLNLSKIKITTLN